MPLYEYYCRRCKARFELLRPMSRSSEPATCPAGHPGAGRTVSLFSASSQQDGGGQMALGGGGGCAACAADSCTSCDLR